MLWILLGGLVGALLDPIRWVVGAVSGWFISNALVAYAVGIGCPLLISARLAQAEQSTLSGLECFGGIAASALIVLIFSRLRLLKSVSKQEECPPLPEKEETETLEANGCKVETKQLIRHSVLDPCPEGEDPTTYMLEKKHKKGASNSLASVTGFERVIMDLLGRLTIRDYLWAFLLLVVVCGYVDIKHSLDMLSEEIPSTLVTNEELLEAIQVIQKQVGVQDSTVSYPQSMGYPPALAK